MRDRLPRALLALALAAPSLALAEEPPAATADAPAPAAAPSSAPQPVVAPAPVVTPAPQSPPQPAPGPLSAFTFDLHGYYRARFTAMGNVPVARLDDKGFLASETHAGRDDASGGTFFNNRLRLDPALRFGGDPAAGVAPRAAVYAQLDLLDSVVWGDNARRASVPLFATNPTKVAVDGADRPDVLLRRLWLEVALPVGQLRLGRQGSHGGLGILFNDGNGFRNDFGDADYGTTFDRVLFATRPITVLNAIRKGDRSETPLVWILGYDRLVQDPLGFGSDPAAATTRLDAGPFGWRTSPTCGDAADPAGTAPTRKCDANVGQLVTGLIWRDEHPRWRRETDELTVGAIYVRRSQPFTDSQLHILDAFWRLQVGLGEGGPSLLTEGEAAMIRGSTRGIKLLPGGLFDENTGIAERALEGDILNWAARAGLTTPRWDAVLEAGHASGDEQLVGDPTFKVFPMSPDYRMGLLMWPVALFSRSYNTNAGRASDALHGGGGVFNGTYLNAKGRYRITRESHQVELVGQGVFGWAGTLNGGKVLGFTADYYAPRNAADPWANNTCAVFESACALGTELDLAVRVKWLPASNVPGMGANDQYRLHWSTEAGVMWAGNALAPRLAVGADTLWTVQSRIAVVW